MFNFVDKIYRFVLTRRKLTLAVAGVLLVVCALCIPSVKVNYQFSDYLPETTESTIALHTMNEAFSEGAAPNARMMAQGLNLMQASSLASALESLDGVDGVVWLGSVADVSIPLDVQDSTTVEAYKQGDSWFYQLTLDTSYGSELLDQMRSAASDAGASDVALAGEAVNTASAKGSSMTEIQLIMVMAVVVILGLLLLTTHAWFEPVLFLSVIGASIVFNLGTNIIFGEISFITQMCAAVLQLAVSMDYGIVMLHTYRGFKKEGTSSFDAAVAAMHKASGVIASSAATTFFGFLSLCVMAFLIGQDMGLVLAKGIVFSFFSVLLLLPVLILTFERQLDRTTHRELLPPFNKFGKWCVRLSVPFAVVVLLLAVPAYLAQSQPNFVYGASGFVEPGTQLYEEAQEVEEVFGAEEQWVLLVPSDQWGTEKQLVAALEDLPNVQSVTSYVTAVSERIPSAFVPQSSLSQLVSNGWSRMIISTSVEGETDEAFTLAQAVRDTANEYFPGQAQLVGSAVTSYDMSLIVNSDSLRVLLASVVAIGLVLVLMFRSLSIPVLLVGVIELSTWINLAIPYFMGDQIQYIGYLIISAIMLGATVDYCIILTKAYLERRETMPASEAMRGAIANSGITILTSATILTVCGALIGVISSNGVISGLGTLIGRGAFISALNTFLLVPTLFIVLDKVIEKTTLKTRFFHEAKE